MGCTKGVIYVCMHDCDDDGFEKCEFFEPLANPNEQHDCKHYDITFGTCKNPLAHKQADKVKK